MSLSNCYACETNIQPTKNADEFEFFPTSLHYPRKFDDLRIVRCRECGFATTNESVPRDTLQRYYERYYIGKAYKLRRFESLRAFGPSWFDSRALSQVMLLSHFVDLSKVESYFEVGPGEGSVLVTLKKTYPRIQLFTSEPQSFKKPLFRDLGAQLEKDVLDPTSTRRYDLVFMSHSLEHFNGADVPEVLRQIFDRLNPGGHYFCEIPHADLARFPLAGERVVPHLTFFSKRSIEKLMERTGFEIRFSGCAGSRQDDKKYDEEVFRKLERQGTFKFKSDDTGEFLINQKLAAQERSSSRRPVRDLIANLPFAVELKRKVAFRGPLSHLKDPHFQYSEDREFIRIIGRKPEVPA